MDQPARQHRGGYSVNSAHRCLKQVDRFRAHKAGTLALTSAPPLQTSFNLWEADKFLSVFLAQPPQTPYSSRLKTVRSRLPLTTRQRGKHVLNEGLGFVALGRLGHPGRRVELNKTIVRESNCERAAGP
jgi:hypothetical protein